jgi:hypothetical protein
MLAARLKSGEEATSLVSFDPNHHGPEGIGVQRKVIRIPAGEIRKPLAEIRLTATVIDETEGKRVPVSPKAESQRRKGRH